MVRYVRRDGRREAAWLGAKDTHHGEGQLEVEPLLDLVGPLAEERGGADHDGLLHVGLAGVWGLLEEAVHDGDRLQRLAQALVLVVW